MKKIFSILKHKNNLLEQCLISVTNFLIIALAGRFLGDKHFSSLVIWFSYLFLCNSISSSIAGNPSLVIIKTFQSDTNCYNNLTSRFCILIAFISAIVHTLLFTINFKTNQFIILILCFLASFSLICYENYRKLSYANINGSTLSKTSLSVFLTFIVSFYFTHIYLELNLIMYLTILITAYLPCVGYWYYRYRRNDILDKKLKFNTIARNHLNYGKPILLGIILYWVANQGYFVFAAEKISDIELGAARAAQNLLGVFMLFTLTVENTLIPRAAKQFQDNGLEYLKIYLKKNFIYIFSFTLILFLIITPFIGKIFFIIYGDKFNIISMNKILITFAVIQVLTMINRFFTIYIKVVSSTKVLFFSYGISALYIVTIGRYLVTVDGAYGLSMGLLYSNIISTILLIGYIKKIKISSDCSVGV